MNKWYIIIGIILWILLFLIVYFVGGRILDTSRKKAFKKWGVEERDYAHEKWMFRFYVIAFFRRYSLVNGNSPLARVFLGQSHKDVIYRNFIHMRSL